ncbi:uncharacterized protein L3040_002874 [Drepanopeziza brunnea f. sp. 'multigermtubi']|uniref:uncharacterized protein n=1 Tax=Drepanopeziza brunnea f. sp. 'multigermtubi' TaxID=698441 RepID=UPI00238645F4|nr:hypothetical protein L3040_002874 [Drepanopeziza brunnea f. sp. 'multigermtubi']
MSSTPPSPGDLQAEGLISEVVDIYQQLSALEADLRPCTVINELFGRLVGLSIQTVSEAVTNKVLSDARVASILPKLHQICSTAEYYLEFHWASYISGDDASSSPEEVQSRLEKFPYYGNYTDLTRMELSALSSLASPASPLRKFAFIGSGPLPLTSLCICSSTSPAPTTVFNIDIALPAITLSSQLSQRLGPHGAGMSFTHAPAGDSSTDLRGYDVVYLAALVGGSQEEKEEALGQVVSRMSAGALLVVRSAERLRRLMYPTFDPTTPRVLQHLDICLAVHPYNKVVNSVIIGRVKAQAPREERRKSERRSSKL